MKHPPSLQDTSLISRRDSFPPYSGHCVEMKYFFILKITVMLLSTQGKDECDDNDVPHPHEYHMLFIENIERTCSSTNVLPTWP